MISISIIIPVYQVEQYVQRCLESVIIQDSAEADIECVIVDDCGQDSSMEIVHQMTTAYKGPIRFRMINHKINRGLSVARNTGLQHATGDYVLFIDSDDYLMPDSISYFLENLKAHPDVDLLMGNVKNCKSGDLLVHHIKEPWLIDDPVVFFQRMLRHQIYLYAWNKLIRRTVLLNNDILFIEGILYEDQSWSYHLFSHISSVILLPKVTYVYEYNVNSIVNGPLSQTKVNKTIWSYLVICDKLLDNAPDFSKYNKNLIVDFLLFVCNPMMRASDMLSLCNDSVNLKYFMVVRRRLIERTWNSRRFVLIAFFMLLYHPFRKLLSFRCFCVCYCYLERLVRWICHITDFMHRK